MQTATGPRPHEHHQRRELLPVEREVVRAQRAQGVRDRIVPTLQVHARELGEPRVVVQHRLPRGDRHLGPAAMGCGDPGGHGLQLLAQQSACLRIQSPQGPSGAGGAGDDVGGLPRDDRGDPQHRRAHGIDHPADDRLQRHDHLGRCQHRIHGQVRIGGVTGGAGDLHDELVRGRIDAPGHARHLLVPQRRLDVRADHGCALLIAQHAGGHDVLRAGGIGLLPRLEHRQQRVRHSDLVDGPGEGDQSGHVDVVRARMHDTAVPRLPFHAGGLMDRQRVHLTAHADRRARPSEPQHRPGPCNIRSGHPLGQGGDDGIARRGLLPGEAGTPMQLMPQFHGGGQVPLQRVPQGCGVHRSSALLSHARDWASRVSSSP